MAVATDTHKARANMAVTQYDFDPDGTSAVDVAWVDMRDFGRILIGFFRTVGTSDLTFKVLGNSASDGGGTDVEVKAKTLTGVQPNAVGDYTWVECSAEDIKQAAVDAGVAAPRYVSANLTFATGTDEAVVTYIRCEPRFARKDLTADNIA
jgi:hypothetical protein